MMADIFASFDPMTYSPSTLPNTISLLTPIIIPLVLITMISHSALWTTPSHIKMSLNVPSKFIWTQLKHTLVFNIKMTSSIITTLFTMLIMINILGLAPYLFSLSSHLLLTLTFALPLWLSNIMSSASFKPTAFFAHFLPTNSPNWMSPFLILVESVSTIVRPITLSFRLGANMTAGHTVMALLSTYNTFIMFTLSPFLLLSTLLIQLSYFMFEMGICLIQAFIFCLLLSLYSEEHPS